MDTIGKEGRRAIQTVVAVGEGEWDPHKAIPNPLAVVSGVEWGIGR